jgi:hypothetical protein
MSYVCEYGAANVVCDELEVVLNANERFDVEYQWIKRLRSEGHPLINIIHSDTQMKHMVKVRSKEYQDKRISRLEFQWCDNIIQDAKAAFPCFSRFMSMEDILHSLIPQVKSLVYTDNSRLTPIQKLLCMMEIHSSFASFSFGVEFINPIRDSYA